MKRLCNFCAALVLLVLGAALPLRAAETLLVIEPTESQPRNSEGDIWELKDGRLCLIYTRFRGGGSDNAAADLAMRVSADGGQTWSDDQIVVRSRGGLNVMSVSLLRLENGAMALFYLRKTSLEDCRPLMQVSYDEGKSWTEPIVCINDQVGYYVLNNDRAVQLTSGRIVLPVALHRLQGDPKADWDGQVMCYLSDDNGRNWRRSKDVRQGKNSAGQRVTTQEPGVVELKDGRLMMFCRTRSGSQYVAYSTDAGDTWSQLQPSNLASPCSPATIERMPASGELVCVWNDHSGAHPFPAGKRTPLCVATSSDEGMTWNRSRVLEGYPYGWYCYISMTQLSDGLLLSYCAGDNEIGGLNRLKVLALSRAELGATASQRDADQAATVLLDPTIDYGRSFVNTKATWNSPRFLVESRCRIADAATGETVEYLQCGSCKSENTFASANLFLQDNYDFLPVFSEKETIVFRHRVSNNRAFREVRATNDWWDGCTPRLKHVTARVLQTPGEIFAAMESGKPIVGQTRIVDKAIGRSAVLEYPVKTINWHREKMLWQVDTGPVLLPDLSQPPPRWSHTVQLAYIAFNSAGWADFVVKQPTPVIKDGAEAAKVMHYSGIENRRVTNLLLAIDGE